VRRLLVGLVALGLTATLGPATASASPRAADARVFAPLLRKTLALHSVTVDTSLDAYPADGSQLRGTADTIVDLTAGRASGYAEIEPTTNIQWWRDGEAVLLQGFAVDIHGMTVTITDPDPTWSPPLATKGATFALVNLLREARAVHRAPGGRFRFTLPMSRLDRRLRVAMQLTSPNLGDVFSGLTGRYTRGSGTAYVAHGRIVRVEYVVHGPDARPSAAISSGLSRLGRSHPDPPPGPLTARPVD
jgi:hypothetical protein